MGRVHGTLRYSYLTISNFRRCEGILDVHHTLDQCGQDQELHSANVSIERPARRGISRSGPRDMSDMPIERSARTDSISLRDLRAHVLLLLHQDRHDGRQDLWMPPLWRGCEADNTLQNKQHRLIVLSPSLLPHCGSLLSNLNRPSPSSDGEGAK